MMERMNSSMLYLIHCKKFCKFHSVPPPSTTIKKKGGRELVQMRGKKVAVIIERIA
jgi:hypothetical protein